MNQINQIKILIIENNENTFLSQKIKIINYF